MSNAPIVSRDFTNRLLDFITEINRRHNDLWTRMKFTHSACPMIDVRPYKPSQRWLALNRSGSVVAFIDTKGGFLHNTATEIGDIFKPANYRSPTKWARGNLMHDDRGASALTDDGYIRYLR